MARETKEERIAREAREERQRAEERAAYLATVPNRLLVAHALAREVGVSVDLQLTAVGVNVRFYEEDGILDDTLNHTSEEWELESLERRLSEKKAEKEAIIRRRSIAEDVWANRLTVEEKVALKENIYLLGF